VVEHPGYEADHSSQPNVEDRMSVAVKAVPLLHAQEQLQLDTFVKSTDVIIE
jgi:hypothetical protein